MTSPVLLLPSELKHLIAGLSSPNSLASLARTHTSFQREAEQALYRTISIHTRNEDSLRCLETLATNSEKATLVRFLMVEWNRFEPNVNQRSMPYLLKGLVNMHSLSDFRLRMHSNEVGLWIRDLHKILCKGHFQLHTLYCNDNLDISRIINSQTKVQILGIYANNTYSFLKTLKQFHSAQSSIPMVISLERESFLPVFDHISIFPAFYPPDRTATIHQVLVKSFDEDQGTGMLAKVDKVSQLCIYLIDCSDMSMIYALAKNMAESLPDINWLNFWFERRCEIPSQDMKQVLSCFPKLHEVNFYLWLENDRNTYPKIPENVKLAHAREWGSACPELSSVVFIDGSYLQEKEWAL